MFKVSYTHLRGYGVSRTFGTVDGALEFIHVNALVAPLPNVRLVVLGSTDPASAARVAAECRRTLADYAVSELDDTCLDCGAPVRAHRDPNGATAAVVADLAAAERGALADLAAAPVRRRGPRAVRESAALWRKVDQIAAELAAEQVGE